MSLMCDFPLLRDRFWPPGPGDRDSPRVSSAPASPTKEGDGRTAVWVGDVVAVPASTTATATATNGSIVGDGNWGLRSEC